jgi:hypothetical protein
MGKPLTKTVKTITTFFIMDSSNEAVMTTSLTSSAPDGGFR